jgi:hypothetical protein
MIMKDEERVFAFEILAAFIRKGLTYTRCQKMISRRMIVDMSING